MQVLKQIEKIYLAGFRQSSNVDCGPASVILCAKAFGLKRITFNTLLSENRYGRWINRVAGRGRGMILTELHFATEAAFGKSFEVRMKRAYQENFKEFLTDLRRCKTEKMAIILNFNQDYLLNRPYKNDETANTHYSPICALDSKLVTIADVDMTEVEYSVSIKEAFNSMSEPHHIFGYPRGWLTIRQRSPTQRGLK